MVQIVADLHLHSKYSRAVSPQMVPEIMAKYAAQKGLDLLATGDWTHPLWYRELISRLEETNEGIFTLKSQINTNNQISKSLTMNHEPRLNRGEPITTNFLLSVEISCIYTQKGKGRRVHNLVFAPGFEAVEKINKELLNRGYNLTSDGRPIIGLSSKNLLQLILEIDERCMIIPAHIWTPWFGVLGEASGFNSLQECFEELTPDVYGIETGLSSDPEMNWLLKELDTRSILSFSDAHSPAKMGREATVFELEKLTYGNIREAIMKKGIINRVLYTLEFYPEEGKYHYSGHRLCNVTMTPEEQRQNKGICPVCHRPVTDGVMRRVQELSNQELRTKNQESKVRTENKKDIKWYTDPLDFHPPFIKLVPLQEIIAEAVGSTVSSQKVNTLFVKLCEELKSEVNVLLEAGIEDIKNAGGIWGERIAEGVRKVREGAIVVKPGYDGVYGVVKIWHEGESVKGKASSVKNKKQVEQMGLF